MRSLAHSFKRPVFTAAFQPSSIATSNRTTALRVSQRSVQNDAALAAFKKAKLIPIIFQERITTGSGLYKYNDLDTKKDIEDFKKREAERKIETNVLEFLKDGETEETVDTALLFERYVEKFRADKQEQTDTLAKIQQGKEILHEHPYDVLQDVSSPHAASFQECWKKLNDFERLRFPGQFPRKSLLWDIMRLSRTRLHFVRTLHWLHMYDKTNIKWNDSDKMQILQFCDKHDYLPYVVNKLTDPLSKFFPNRSHFEFGLRMSLRMKRISDAELFETIIRKNYKVLSKKGYHHAVQYSHIAGQYHKAVRFFIELLSTSPKSFSTALWEHFFKSLLLGHFPKAMNDLKPLIPDQKTLPDFVVGGLAMGFAFVKDKDSMKEILSKSEDPHAVIKRAAAWVTETDKFQKKNKTPTLMPEKGFPELTTRIRAYGREILKELRPRPESPPAAETAAEASETVVEQVEETAPVVEEDAPVVEEDAPVEEAENSEKPPKSE